MLKNIVFCVFVSLHIGSALKSFLSKPATAVNLRCDPLYFSKSGGDALDTKKEIIAPWLSSFSTACFGGLLFGLDIGSSSSVLRILGSTTTSFGNLDALQLGQVASCSLLGAIISSALIVFVGDTKLGRKNELQLAATLYTFGTVVQSFSNSYPLLLLGRVLYGLGIGTAMHVAPLYIAETSPDKLRGRLISLKEAAIVAGIVLGYSSGAFYSVTENWQGVFLSALPAEFLMLIGSILVPESPRWLALRGKKSEAIKVVQSLQGIDSTTASKRISEMSITDSTVADGNEFINKMTEIVSSKYNRRALLIGVGLVLFQQLSGQPSVLYFANRIFESTGLGFEAAVGVGVFKLIMTFISSFLVENPNCGRRTLLLYGNAGVTISLFTLSILYYVGSMGTIDPSLLQQLVIASILVFVGSYQIGFGPITWLILSEIFPLSIRSAAVSLGTLSNFGSNLFVTLLFDAERVRVGEPLLFLQFGLIALAATIFTYKYVFETRGLSLEEIEKQLVIEVDKLN